MDIQSINRSWLDVAFESEEDPDLSGHSFQDEDAEPGKVFKTAVYFFGKFILAIPSDDLEDIEQPKFSELVRDLCGRAPSVAQHLNQEILKHLANTNQPEAQISKEHASTNFKEPSRRRTQTRENRAYQPPKPSIKQLKTGGVEPQSLDAVFKCRYLHANDSITHQASPDHEQINRRNGSPITERTSPVQEAQPIQKAQSQEYGEDILESFIEAHPQQRVQYQPVIDISFAFQSEHDNQSTNQSSDNLTVEESQPIQKTLPSQKAQSLHECSDNTPGSVTEEEQLLQEGEQDQPTFDDSVTCQPDLDSISINRTTDSPEMGKTQSCQNYEEDISGAVIEMVSQEVVQDQAAPIRYTTCNDIAENLPKPTHSSDDTIGDEALKESPVIIEDSTKNGQATCLPSLPKEARHMRLTSPEIDGTALDAQEPLTSSPHNGKPHKTAPSTPSPSTPPRQNGQQLPSPPLTEIDGTALDAQEPLTSSPHDREPHKAAPSTPSPSTPPRQNDQQLPSPSDIHTITPNTSIFTPTMTGSIQSPLTEIDQTMSPSEKAEITHLEGIISPSSLTGQQQTDLSNTASTQIQVDGGQFLEAQDCQTKLPSSLQRELPELTDMIAQTIQTILAMTISQEVPSELHYEIISTIRPSLDVIPGSSTAVEGDDSIRFTSCSGPLSASMWLNMLEASEARSKKATIRQMIVMMGASDWYDEKLAEAEREPPPTKRGVPRKRLATIVLDEYLNASQDSSSADIQKSIFAARRKKLIKLFHKGRVIRKLVRMMHLGILFDQNIWSYVKLSNEDIDKLATSFQGDPQKMKIMSILDEQVVLLVKTGQPDLSRFFDSLESHSITTSEEVSSLRAKYGRENEPVPQVHLQTACNRIVERVSHVLYKEVLGDDDVMMVNGTFELSCGLFNRLRSQTWLYGWDLTAVMEMTDRPISVKLGHSIQLHKKDAEGKITPLQNPFRRWRSEIDTYRRENESGLEGSLVYFCPLNLNTNHFSLLEINEQTKMIYHYDSMASSATIHRKTKSTPTRRRIEEEFNYLNFGYTEVPCPQQDDGWSCGLMVLRNAKKRMTGLPVGSWKDEVNPDRVIIEILGDCQTCLEKEILRPASLFKKRKRGGEGLQKDAPEPTRVSKRLKQISVDS